MTTYSNILNKTEYTASKDSLVINCIDMHTGGEPLRVILNGYPELKGNSVLEYRNYFKNNLDHIRTALMYEPRGHADMYGCVLLPPNDKDADFGIIFLHNEGYSTMCGHAIIAISTLAAEMGWIEIKEGENELRIDAPCGRVTSFVKIKEGKVEGVKFHSVPSFVVGLDLQIEVPGIGNVKYDLAYGGAYYAYVNAAEIGLSLDKTNYSRIIDYGRKIKQAVIESGQNIEHPFEQDLSFLYGTIFIDESEKPELHSKNVCVFADGEVDRCPTGSGVSGRMAIHSKRNEIEKGEVFRIESITGSIFDCSVHDTVEYGTYKDAVVAEVEGTAFVTGQHRFIVDANDPMKDGFLLR